MLNETEKATFLFQILKDINIINFCIVGRLWRARKRYIYMSYPSYNNAENPDKIQTLVNLYRKAKIKIQKCLCDLTEGTKVFFLIDSLFASMLI